MREDPPSPWMRPLWGRPPWANETTADGSRADVSRLFRAFGAGERALGRGSAEVVLDRLAECGRARTDLGLSVADADAPR